MGLLETRCLDLIGGAHKEQEARHRNLRAESRLGVRDRHVDDEVVAAARERLRRSHARDHVEIAGLGAAVAGLALAAQADPRAVLDAGRNLDRVALGAPLAAGAAAVRARILDHGAVPAAARAGLGEGEQALALGDDAAAVTLGAQRRRGPGLRARAAAFAARGLELDRDLRLDPVQRVLEREPDLDLDVAAPLAALLLLRATPAAHVREEAAEDVAEIAQVADVEALAEVEAAARP